MLQTVSFLVGAGLVKDAGLPLSVDLANKLHQTLQLNEDEKCKQFLDLYRFLDGGIRFHRGVVGDDPSSPINIEEIANVAIKLKERNSNPILPYVAGWHPRLSEIENFSSDLLDEFAKFIYSRLEKWLSIPDEEDRYAYLRLLADIKNLKTINIFSLNYDLLIEDSFYKNDISFQNGFSEMGWNIENYDEKGRGIVNLFKLHGSLDWVDDELFGISSLQFPRHKNVEDFSSDLEPHIIFGTDEKLTGKEPFLSLTYKFSEQLSVSRVLVVIGYSFADNHLNDIIMQRMRDNLQLRIVVVSPSAEDLIKSSFLKERPTVTPIQHSAKRALTDNFVSSVVKELLDESKEEKPF